MRHHPNSLVPADNVPTGRDCENPRILRGTALHETDPQVDNWRLWAVQIITNPDHPARFGVSE